MDQDHPPFGIEQVHVVDHLGAPPVHVQNRLAHQVFVEQNPAFLIDKARIRRAAFRGAMKMASSSIRATFSQGMSSEG